MTRAELTVTYVLESVSSVDADVRPFSRPPLTAWFGHTDGSRTSIIAHLFEEAPATAGSATVTAHWELELPPGGLYVPAGHALLVQVGSYYVHDVGVHLDAAESRLDVRLEPAPALDGRATTGRATVQVTGAACMVRDPSGVLDAQLVEQAVASTTFQVPKGSSFLEVRATTQAGDADFWLDDPEGTEVVHALGSGDTETVLLGPDNLAGRSGPWTVHAYACSPTDGSIALDWTVRD